MMRTETPSRVSQSANTSPVGPAPTIRTGTSIPDPPARSLLAVMAHGSEPKPCGWSETSRPPGYRRSTESTSASRRILGSPYVAWSGRFLEYLIASSMVANSGRLPAISLRICCHSCSSSAVGRRRTAGRSTSTRVPGGKSTGPHGTNTLPSNSAPNVAIASRRRPLGLRRLLRLQPRHHLPQPAPGDLDRVVVVGLVEALEVLQAVLVLGTPFLRELAGLDLGEDPLHLGLGLLVDDARAAGEVAVLGGVADAVAHVTEAALVDQVDDQLHLVDALEVSHLRRVAGLDQRLEP